MCQQVIEPVFHVLADDETGGLYTDVTGQIDRAIYGPAAPAASVHADY